VKDQHRDVPSLLPGTSRRELLKTFAAAGAGAMLPVRELLGQAGGPGAIDVHQHYQAPFAGSDGSRWSVSKVLELMDKNGIATVIISGGSYGDQVYTGTEAGRTMARKLNDYAAKIVTDHPKKFGFFAVIPYPDADGSLKEIEYAYDTLKADGVGILSSIGDKWPGDPAFLPAFEELNRRKAVAFVHPFVPKCCRDLIPAGEASVERDFDTTRAVTNLLYSGTLAQLPDIRYIINHSGAAVPVMAGRIKDRIPGASSYPAKPQTEGKTPKTPNGVFYELRKLYYECAHAAYPAAMAALTKFAPPSQYLFGTDFPAEDPASTLNELKTVELSPEVLRALYRGNAERLFPRLKMESSKS
jgi:predicted TIM-barrel fold metal-dependent hydrolase